MIIDRTTDTYDTDYHAGYLVITDKANGAEHCVQLRNNNGRNITQAQFKAGIASHGFDRACRTFIKLAAN
tara:strand:+ start:327 stop:536 length:210 start_codon:yes stop_codon:yes gene_type:complete